MGGKKNTSTAAAGMIDLIRELIQQELIKEDDTSTCQIMACNSDGTYDIAILPDTVTTIKSVKSISPENLKQGDYAYIYKFKNKLNNAIIIAKVGGQGDDVRFVTPDSLSETITNVTGGPFLPLTGGTLSGSLDVTPASTHKYIRVNSPTGISSQASSELMTYDEYPGGSAVSRAVLALSDPMNNTIYRTTDIKLGNYTLSFPTLDADKTISTDHVSGTNDGTYWTSLTINGTTKSIGGGGSSDNQTIKQGSVTFGANDVIDFVGGGHITITGNATNKTMTLGVDSNYSIPSTSSQQSWDAKYTKPSGGIPDSDIAFNYAGSSSKGGAATSANKLNTDAGSATQPIYFSNGVPVATTYALNKTVPSDAVFTDHTYNFAGVYFESGDSGAGLHDCNEITYNSHNYYTSNGPDTSLGATTTDGALYTQAYSSTWVAQIAQDYRNGRLFVRGKNNGSWTNWSSVALTSDIQAAIEALPEPMIFKGTIGDGGTYEWVNLPAANASHEGWVLKAISANANMGVKAGDTLICANLSTTSTPDYSWVIVPSGDEPSGTVTNVGLSLPSDEFTVSGSPVTSSGTLTGTWKSQSAHFVFAAPSNASGTPSFRALVASDLPSHTHSEYVPYIGASQDIIPQTNSTSTSTGISLGDTTHSFNYIHVRELSVTGGDDDSRVRFTSDEDDGLIIKVYDGDEYTYTYYLPHDSANGRSHIIASRDWVTSQIPVVTNYYWADVQVSASSNKGTSPTVSTITIGGNGSTAGKATMQYNTTEDCIEFIFA